MIDLNLHEYKESLRIKKEKNEVFIFDIIRKKHILLQPEELVRQLLIHYLIDNGYPKEKIQVEKSLTVNEQSRRFDIVVYDQHFEPFLLVECKSHKVPITQAVFDQIALYNLSLKAPYLLVSNGVQTYCCRLDRELKEVNYEQKIPSY